MIRKGWFGLREICTGFFFIFLFFHLAGNILAQHGHGGGAPSPSSRGGTKGGVPERGPALTVTVESLKVSLEVMSMGEHMKHTARGASHSDAEHAKSHSLMVRIQDLASKEIISDARVAYTLSAPSGAKEKGKLTWSGDHYAAAANLKEKGTYRVQLTIESGGMEKLAGFEYQAK